MPRDPRIDAFLAEAAAAAARGALDEAADAAARAVLVDAREPAGWEMLVAYRIGANQGGAAVAEAHDGLRHHPGSARLWLLLATALAGASRPRGALAAAAISLHIDPNPGLASARVQMRRWLGQAAADELEARYAAADPVALGGAALVEELLTLD